MPRVDYLELVRTAGEVAGAIAEVILDVVTLLTDPTGGRAGVECLELGSEVVCGEMKIGVMPIGPRRLTAGPRYGPWAGAIRSEVTAADKVMYRVWGGEAGRVGGWLTPVPPAARLSAIRGLALPPGNSAEMVSEVLVPAGTRIQVGHTARAFGQPGGSPQVLLLDPIPAVNFKPGTPLGPH